MWLSVYFILFIFYSFIGWFYESAIFSVVKHHKFIDRGYLIGPCCPIYGIGAVINLFILKDITNAALIFIISMVTACILEYFTSYAMERLFDARWWDYSEYPFNLDGRICLYGCLSFGVGNVILIKFVNPLVVTLIDTFSLNYINLISLFLLFIIFIDTTFSTIRLKKFNEKLQCLQDSVNEIVNSIIGDKKRYIKDNLKIIKGNELTISILNVKKHFKIGELRILHAFPMYYSTRYNAIIEKIKETITK